MFSTAAIKQNNRRQAEKAAQRGEEPYVPYDASEIRQMPPFPFPNIGDHRPDGWELEDTLFCDSSGFGSSGEPALTTEQLIEKLLNRHAEPGVFGYAIIEEGQFQLHLGVFRRTDL